MLSHGGQDCIVCLHGSEIIRGHMTEVKATAINAPTQATELFIANGVENLIPVTNIPLFLII
jgi:hypothetical protein